MRNNTTEVLDIRWEVLKSMLDDFPQLRDRTEKYLVDKKNPVQIRADDHINQEIRKMMLEAVSECRKDRLRK